MLIIVVLVKLGLSDFFRIAAVEFEDVLEGLDLISDFDLLQLPYELQSASEIVHVLLLLLFRLEFDEGVLGCLVKVRAQILLCHLHAPASLDMLQELLNAEAA
uniref:Uncharacterized protein n=1 Tax=Strombidium rassoulzadegani TaxID=1082188 RepID=A0A7S3FR84_9SPIT